MKAADLRAKTPDELEAELMNLRKEQFNFRFQKSTGQLENTGRVRIVRRDIARIKTILSEIRTGKAPTAKPAKKAAKAKTEKSEAAEKAPKKKKAKE